MIKSATLSARRPPLMGTISRARSTAPRDLEVRLGEFNMTLAKFARKLCLALALTVACGLAFADEPKPEAANNQNSTATRGTPNDSTPLTGRKLVKLNRPVPATREYVPFDPRTTALEKSNEEAPKTIVGDGDELEVVGREIVDFRFQSGQGRYMLEDEMGMIRIFPQSAIESVEDAPDGTLDELRAKMEEELKREFGDGFWTLSTPRYLFVSDASEGYVKWCSRLFDSLDDSFRKYAKKRRLELVDRVEPLVVVIFSKQSDFMKYASVETNSSGQLVAYYNLQTNRVALYDLSGAEGTSEASSRKRRTTTSETREFLSRPNAAFNVATIIHEATHQLAFNSGVFKRSGPVALWSVEGLSLVFETPVGSIRQNGWTYRGILPTNERMKAIFETRFGASRTTFKSVVEQESYYADLETSYAASWALYYYLEKKRPGDLGTYLRLLAEKQACTVYSKEDRVADFEACFGDDWEKLTKNVLNFVRRL